MGINQIERLNDQQEALRTMLKAFAAGMWVALPGTIHTYDATRGLVSVQPTIEMLVTQSDGTKAQTQMPVVVDCPVIYLGGGGFVATFPIAQGDEALVIFADRCIDGWWQNGGVQPQAELRMHSLSDGFALIGPRSLAKSIPNVSTTTAQLRSLDGSTYVEIAGSNIVNIVAPGGVNITGPLNVNGAVAITGNASISGTAAITGDITGSGKVTATGEGTFNTVQVSQHVHAGVQSGGSSTAPPTPGT